MIFVYGSVNADIVVFTEKFVEPKETMFGANYIINQGGKGANQAIAASKLGGDSLFLGRIGKDNFGEFVEKEILKNGVKNHLIKDDNNNTGIALIEVNKEGENRIIVVSGANNNTGEKELKFLENNFKSGDILLLQGEIQLQQNIEATKIVKNKGVIIFDPAPANKNMIKIIDKVDFITPNEVEFEYLYNSMQSYIKEKFKNKYVSNNAKEENITKEDLFKEELLDKDLLLEQNKEKLKEINEKYGISEEYLIDLNKKSAFLLKMGVKNIIVKLGEKGIFFKNNNLCFYQNGNKINAIDTTAAGDTFNGALAFYFNLLFSENKREIDNKKIEEIKNKMDKLSKVRTILKKQNMIKTYYFKNDKITLLDNIEVDKSFIFAQIAASYSVTKKGASISSPALQELIEFL